MQNTNLPLIEFRNARARIAPHIRSTPLEYSPSLSRKFQHEIYLKLENWQITGAFKIRGALNKLLTLSDEEKRRGVITASAGNHGLGVAHACQILGIAGKIVVPVNASPAKIKALQNYNVELIQFGRDYDEAEEFARQVHREQGLTFVHGFSEPHIIAGQGTIALEILEALPEAGTIVVPIGGGGLIAGVALAAKSINPKIKIVGVQSEASPAMYNSLRAGKPIETPIADTLADGLAGRFVTEFNLKFIQKWVDGVLLVSEAAIQEAMRLVLESEHILIEGSAAVGLAAMIEKKVRISGKTVLILTGRNVALPVLKAIV